MPATFTRCAVALLVSIVAAAASAQEKPVISTPDDLRAPWTGGEREAPDAAFRFAVVSDNAGGPRQGAFAAAVRKLNLLRPQFVMSIGDFVEGYEDAEEALIRQWEVFEHDLAPLEAPFFYVPGNHDNGRPLWDALYRKRIGATYYSFRYRDVLFLCLCANDGSNNGTGVSDAQVAFIEDALAADAGVRWTMVFIHKPLWDYPDDDGWPRIAAALGDRPYTAFAGHTHENLSHDLGPNQQRITLGTTGGGSPLRGPDYGEFDQIAWVTMEADRPHVAIIALDAIFPHDFRTPDHAQAIAPFKADQAVQLEIIHADAPEFSEGVTKLHLSNPTPEPLVFRGLFEVDPGMRAEPAAPSFLLEPGASVARDIRITLDAPLPVGRVQPPILHWTADIAPDAPGVRATRFHGRAAALIDRVFACPRATTPIAVDGDLSDWGPDSLAYHVTRPGQIFQNPHAWRGPHDGSYRFDVRHDGAALHFAIEARDDERCFDGYKYWSDFIAVYLGVPQTGDATSPGGVNLFSLFAAPAVPESTVRDYTLGEIPANIQMAARETDDGYTAEIAVPLASLAADGERPLQGFLMNIGMSDHDPAQTHEGVTILHWRPRPTGDSIPRAFGVFLME